MTNVTVQEALKSIELAEETGNLQDLINALNLCKAALAEIEKCEPLVTMKKKDNKLDYSIAIEKLDSLSNGTYKLYTSPISKED